MSERRDGEGDDGESEAALRWRGSGEGAEPGKGADPSGVDGDDLAAASADQQDPVEALCEDLQELHVWGGRS